MFELRINALKVVCGVLQIIGLICIFSIKMANPAWLPFLWAVVAVSGFAAFVQMITDKHMSVFGNMIGFAGCGLLLVSLLEFVPQ